MLGVLRGRRDQAYCVLHAYFRFEMASMQLRQDLNLTDNMRGPSVGNGSAQHGNMCNSVGGLLYNRGLSANRVGEQVPSSVSRE